MVALFDRFEICMTLKEAQSGSHQGRCDSDVKALIQLPKIKRQLSKISDSDLVTELQGWGAWDAEELAVRSDNESRIIWLAAGDIVEGR